MTNRRYQEVQPRDTVQLLPPCLDDYVAADNPVRAIDAYVDSLDLGAMGFRHAEMHSGSGQPPFDPALLLKLYMYGYQNRIHSSRRLEAATRCNVEVMWLCQNARPSYKTIADFRKDNLKALKQVNRDFVGDCRELSLLGGTRVAVDGTFLKASANRDSVHTKASLERSLARLDKLIESHYRAMDQADASDSADDDPPDPDLVRKMEELLARRAKRQALQEQLEASGGTQVSEVDPDARLLSRSGRSVVGYNGQIAVDDKAKLIVATELVQDGNDSGQLEPMMTRASEAIGSSGLTGLADTGYANGNHLKACGDKGMEMYVPLPDIRTRKGRNGRIGSGEFLYDRTTDSYVCPTGHKLVHKGQMSVRKDKRYLLYRSDTRVCKCCPLASRCLSGERSYRPIYRWEHEDVMDRHRQRMADDKGEVMGLRGSLVEHPFGTLKVWAGVHHFLMRGLHKCRGEFNLMALCYNFRRVLKEIGVEAFVAYCRVRKEAQGIGV